jgi:hypothetical protein
MQIFTASSIPREIDLFDPYLRITNSYFAEGNPTNASRLKVPEPHQVVWDGFLTRWIPIFEKYADKFNKRTPAVIKEANALIEEVRKFDEENNFLARIAIAENVTITDLETFNIRNGNGTRQNRTTTAHTAITEEVDVKIKPIGGGSVTIKCYGKGARASILEAADSVQYRYVVGVVAPTSAKDEMLDTKISTKGSFVLAAGEDKVGLRLYIYFRWYNTRHPEIAGPWSTLQNSFIL